MKSTYIVIYVVLFFSSVISFAENSAITMHLECEEVSADCLEMSYFEQDQEKMLTKKNPELVITASEIAQAGMASNQFGQEELQIRLKEEPSAQFAKLTGENVGKRLAIVANNKVLLAPMIREPISSGSFTLTPAIQKDSQYLEGLPWLKEMIEKEGAGSNSKQSTFIFLISIVVGALILVAFYAIILRRGPTIKKPS